MKFTALLLLLATGCMGHVARALTDGAAILSVQVGSPWGMQNLVRVGMQTNEVTIAPNGTVTVKPIVPVTVTNVVERAKRK